MEMLFFFLIKYAPKVDVLENFKYNIYIQYFLKKQLLFIGDWP